MATSRKKQDEKNLKILRELGALPQNKYCFDCNQRGPTYVNVTIGSFVCTKCSGILRGLTPPHRVKSISMATFTGEEVELLRNRGNEYCRRVWLGLYEDVPPTYNGDEQAIRDLMVDKYERKRFYLDYKPDVNNARTIATATQRPVVTNRITNSINTVAKNNNIERTRPELPHKNGNANGNKTTMDFIADFDKAEIFSSGNNNVTMAEQRNGFANFDNNPVFTNNAADDDDDFSIFDLKFTNNGPVFNQVPLFPRCNVNRWSMPPNAFFNNVNAWNQQTIPQPVEDKYAALKDLDNEIKSQTAIDWSSNGSLYSSPTPTGSVYSSPSPQNSVFGSPSQGQFMSAFASQENGGNVSNPFSNGVNWSNGNNNGQPQPFANPFQEAIKTNGFSANFKTAFPINPMPINGANSTWTPNPFKVGAATTNSTNPFL